MTKIGVVVPVLKNFQGAVEALASLKSFFPIELHIIPNHQLGLSVAKSWNKGVRDAIGNRCTHILIINDDILFSEDTIDNMIWSFSNHPEPDGREVVMTTGRNVRGIMSPNDLLQYKNPGAARQGASESPDFSCFMIKNDFFSKIGTFDENFYPAYFEDNDAHRRINLLGYKALNVNAPFYHFGSVTQNWQDKPACIPDQFLRNKEYYILKWGGAPGEEKYSHPYNRDSISPKQWLPLEIS